MDQPADRAFVCDESGRESTESVDFAFLAAQTFGDAALERDLLELFVTQIRRIVPGLPASSAQGQADTAHLLIGSARGIGAWPAAHAAEVYEAAPADGRGRHYPALVASFAQAAAAIAAHLALQADGSAEPARDKSSTISST